MNFENFFKVKFYKDDIIDNKEDWKEFKEVMLITNKEARVVKKEDYERLFKYKESIPENKVEQPLKKRKNPDVNFKKSLPKKIDPEKKPYVNLSIEELDKEINSYKSKIDDIKIRNSDEGKRKKLEELDKLAGKWLKISQEAISTILELFPQNSNYERNTIKQVIEYFKIDKEAINYDSENECFKD
jgi:hypothetical protein